jgi:hypothetical protein
MYIVSLTFGRSVVVHTAEVSVPRPCHLEVEIGMAMLEKYKSPCSG